MFVMVICLFSMSGDPGVAANSLSSPTSLAFVSGIFPPLRDDSSLEQLFAWSVDPQYHFPLCGGEVLRQPEVTPFGCRICTKCDWFGFHRSADEEGYQHTTIDQVI